METRAVLLIFSLNLKFLGWPYREYIKTAKNGCFHCFSEEFLSESAVLPNFCCYNYGANASEAVGEDRYRSKRLSQMLLKSYSLLHSQSISSMTLKRVGYWDTSGVSKQIAVVAQNKEQ